MKQDAILTEGMKIRRERRHILRCMRDKLIDAYLAGQGYEKEILIDMLLDLRRQEKDLEE